MLRVVTIASLLVLTAGLAAQREAERRPEQRFDAVDPLWDQYWPMHVPGHRLRTVDDVAALGPEESELIVQMSDGTEVLLAALQRERVTRLSLHAMPRFADPLPWAELAKHGELRSLVVEGSRQFVASDLRELRRLVDLESLVLCRCVTLDADTAAALLELPKLRHLCLPSTSIEPGTLRRLAGLPDLVSLGLELMPGEEHELQERFAELVGLRQLRELLLVVHGGDLPAAVRAMSQVPRLRGLALIGGECDDEVLAALPTTLSSLVLTCTNRFTADGLKALAQRVRLQSLSFGHVVRAHQTGGLAGLIAASPLERFELEGMPDEAIGEALAGLPGLRRLSVHVPRDGWPGLVELASRLVRLQTLHVHAPGVPRAPLLGGLQGHPTLQRVLITCTRQPMGGLSDTARAALRTAAGCEVEVQ